MPLSISLADGRVVSGEDKRFSFTPKGKSGKAISDPLQSVELTLTAPDGTTTNKTQADFSAEGDERYVYLSFDAQGSHKIVLAVTGPQGYRERVEDTIFVE